MKLHRCLCLIAGSLQLVTGKMMSPGHINPGVSSVANLLIDRVVRPLRQLNLNDYEHMLLKQIILFNPGKIVLRFVEENAYASTL